MDMFTPGLTNQDLIEIRLFAENVLDWGFDIPTPISWLKGYRTIIVDKVDGAMDDDFFGIWPASPAPHPAIALIDIAIKCRENDGDIRIEAKFAFMSMYDQYLSCLEKLEKEAGLYTSSLTG